MSESPVDVTREYYDSSSADNFYFHVWGGEDIHIGLYQSPEDSIADASRRTVEALAMRLRHLASGARVLDIGAGYGGAGRFLAKQFELHVTSLNLSAVQNKRNREISEEQGLSHLTSVVDGDFENLPFDDDSFDAVWSQDAILHSGDRQRVFAEVDRVLKPGGDFVFTDPMQREGVAKADLKPVLERIHLESMGSVSLYRSYAAKLGWSEVSIDLLTPQLVNHYSSVLRELTSRSDELKDKCGAEYMERMQAGLRHWIDAGKEGRLEWGIFHFRKPK